MPLVPDVGLADAQALAETYRDAELRLLEIIAEQIGDGLDDDDWEIQQLARLQGLNEEALGVLAKTNPAAVRDIRAAIGSAYDRGGLAVLQDIPAGGVKAASAVKRNAVAAFVDDLTTGMAQAQTAILRTTDDVVRQIIAQTVANTITGTSTRAEAAQAAISSFLGNGIQGIEVGRGTMGLPEYAAMAVRTANTRAALRGHTATMQANDLNLVVIHPGPRPCDICDQWARGILSLDDTPAGVLLVPSLLGGEPIEIEVMGTLAEAEADGFMHPNDRCGIGAFLPGVTDPEVIEREPWDQEGYEAQQRQRDIEREIREWKNEAAISLDDERQEDALAKVEEWQQTMRDHLAANDALKRQPGRE